MEDNFYKASSENLFPKSAKVDNRLQRAKQAYEKEAPIIAATITRLHKQIDYYQSVAAIKTEDDPEQFMREVAVNKRIVAILDREVKRLEGEVAKYSKSSQ